MYFNRKSPATGSFFHSTTRCVSLKKYENQNIYAMVFDLLNNDVEKKFSFSLFNSNIISNFGFDFVEKTRV